MEKNKIHQILSNYNNLSEQEQNSIQGLYAAGQVACEENRGYWCHEANIAAWIN